MDPKRGQVEVPQALIGLPCWLTSNESACNAGDTSLIPGWDAPLEKEMATHSSNLTWEIP